MSAKKSPTKTVMVVDDDVDILESIVAALESEGYAVIPASNGAQALDLLSEGARPSIILLDLMMPILDGFEFVERQHQDPELAKIPVVIVSADANTREKAATTPVEGYVQKPFKLEALLAAIERHASP